MGDSRKPFTREKAQLHAQTAMVTGHGGLGIAGHGEHAGDNPTEELEAIFKRAFMMVADACYIATLEEGLVLEVNRAFEDLLGYSREDVIGRTSRDLGLWVDYGDRVAMRDELRAAGFVRQREIQARRKNGERFDCSASASVVTVGGVPCVMGVLRNITERKRAEQAVRESEAKFKTAFMTSPNPFYLVALPEGRFIEVNAAFETILGYSAQEVVGRTSGDIQAFVDPGFRDRTLAEELLPKGFVKDREVLLRTKSGKIIVASLSITLLTLNGHTCTLGTFTDITERKRAERSLVESREALADSQESLIALMDSTNDLIWSVDPVRFGLLRFNKALHEYFARSGIDCRVGMDPAQLMLPPPFVAFWHDRYARALREGPFVEEYVPMAGRPVLLLSLNPVRRGDAVVAISVFAKDINERKEAEAALRASEERFRQVCESVTDFVWEVDAEGVYTYTSPAVEHILKYRPAELVGRRHFYDLYGADDIDELKATALDIFAAKQRFRAFPNRKVNKDGRTVYLETSGVPLLDENGHLRGYRGADSDITERWLADQSVHDLSGRLINAQEAERSRLGRELHDHFCQSLAVLAIKLDRLGQAPPESVATLKEQLDGLGQDVREMSTEVRQLSHELHPGRLEQLGLTAAVRGLCNDLTAAHTLSVRFNTKDVPRNIRDDAALCVYRVAQEALQNVIKHSGAVSASVDLSAADGELCLVVTDDGHGFNVASRESDSVGLGLANMRERVRFVSGRLTIECPATGGTRVEARVPLDARAR